MNNLLPKNEPMKLDTTENLNMFLYGPSFIGKTHFCNTWPNVYFASTDGNLIADEEGNVKPHTLFKRTMPYELGGPGGLKRNISGWEYFKKIVDEIIENDSYETIVIDFINDFYDWMRADILAENGITHESGMKVQGKIWSLYDNEFLPVMKKLLLSDKNVIVISHQKESELMGIIPDLQAALFRKLKKYFKIACRLTTQMGATGAERVLVSQAIPGQSVGNRFNLSQKIVEPDHDKFMAAIKK